MSRATVLIWVDDLSVSQADAGLADDYYDATVQDVSAIAVFTEASLIALSPGVSPYTLPDNAREILTMFYGDTELTKMSLNEVFTYDNNWLAASGSPEAFILNTTNKRDFILYPQPDVNSEAFIFLFGEPFGRDYPEYACAVVHTDVRVDYPEWMDLPLASRIMSLEFKRESDHEDMDLADVWKAAGDLMLEMLFS